MTRTVSPVALRLAAILVVSLAAWAAAERPSVAHADGEFRGDIPTSGVGLGVWSGGDVAGIAASVADAGCSLASVWTAVGGDFAVFIPGAPDAANAAFIAAFGGPNVPAGTALAIVCTGRPPVTAPPPVGPPPAAASGFSDGTYIVGEDIEPGRYRAAAVGPLCYWERLSGFSGEFKDIIANDIPTGRTVVDILPADAGFHSSDCGPWTSDLSPVTSSPLSPFGDGTYIVGVDIAPGTWSAPGGPTCYWERLSGFSGDFAELLANDLPPGNAVVTISADDAGFSTHGCGEWSPASQAT